MTNEATTMPVHSLIIVDDVRQALSFIPDGSIHCCVTSPPYFGLRDYKVAGQIGHEPTPKAYIDTMVDVFRDVRRVLRLDGVCFLNIGDTYSGYHGNKNHAVPSSATNGWTRGTNENLRTSTANLPGFKQKELLLIPERLSIALSDDGWYVRSRIAWCKPNPTPESVTDRPSGAWEHIWMLTKHERYFWDKTAVAEPASGGTTRNLRNVWSIATKKCHEAHFAVFPPEVPELAIKAATSERGCCRHCGAPWTRVADWGPTCDCPAHTPVPCRVLDPFGGSGTTGMVARRMGRSSIMIELNPDYVPVMINRIGGGAKVIHGPTALTPDDQIGTQLTLDDEENE